MSTALPDLRAEARPPSAFGVLVVTLDGVQVHTRPVTDAPVRIGRLPENEVVLGHGTISRHHAEVRAQNGQVVLSDVGSSSGTFVGGTRLVANQPVLFEPGVDVRIGPYTLRYVPNAPAQAILPGVPPEAPSRGPSGPLVPSEVIEEMLGPPPGRPTFPAPRPDGAASRYLQVLPTMFQDRDIMFSKKDNEFLGRFLLIFEAIWEPIEWRHEHFELYFDPRTSPASFLGWLASWLNLTVNAHWPEDRRRLLLDEAMELYRWRGTPYGLMRMIEVCTGVDVQITEAGSEPFTFRVRMPGGAGSGLRELVEEIVATHKPAHVGYLLEVAQ